MNGSPKFGAIPSYQWNVPSLLKAESGEADGILEAIRGILSLSLALACGSFLFVGTHTFLRHHKEAGTVPALAAVCSGLMISIATQWLIR